MTHAALSRPELIARMAEVFRTQGFAGATLAELSQATGLKRASLYHHFPNGKAAMAASVLNDAVAELDAHAFRELAGTGSAQDRLSRFITGFSRYCRGGTRACAISALYIGADEATIEAIRGHLDRWIDLLAALFGRQGASTDPQTLAGELLADLYGALTIATLRGNSIDFQPHLARIGARYRQVLDQRQRAW